MINHQHAIVTAKMKVKEKVKAAVTGTVTGKVMTVTAQEADPEH
jgi:hypothetical protein